jgi:hypothetical protein
MRNVHAEIKAGIIQWLCCVAFLGVFVGGSLSLLWRG